MGTFPKDITLVAAVPRIVYIASSLILLNLHLMCSYNEYITNSLPSGERRT
jgi:hypothetical protein